MIATGSGAGERRSLGATLLLYARTVRHLLPSQAAYLPLRRLQARRTAAPPRVVTRIHEDRARAMAGAVAMWMIEDDAVSRADEVMRGTFRFLNHAEHLAAVDWRRRYVSHLWSYNLQYFGFGVDLAQAWARTGDRRYADRFAALADGWIRDAADGAGDGWEPYAVSMRIVHWTHALLLFGGAVDEGIRTRMAASLGSQLAWLERRLERHIGGNHLQKNYHALLVGGLLLDGADAERWRRTGERGLWRELPRQVLADGGHAERSPMYHAIAMADFLESAALVSAVGGEVPPGARERMTAMAHAFGVLCRPDGRLHLFNDAAHGIAPSHTRLNALAAAILGGGIPEPRGAMELPLSGFRGWAGEDGERLVVDCGAPAPAHQPGHAHCGMLGFELDLAGRPVVVDSGVHGYEGDPLREYVRSTRAHSTVQIGGLEQSEVWGTFRVARRARAAAVRANAGEGGYRFAGTCLPYGGGAHHRAIHRGPDGWRVEDRVDGAAGQPVRSWLHLAPGLRVERDGDGFRVRGEGVHAAVVPFGFDAVEVRMGEGAPAQGWHCPEFGRALPAPVLEMTRVAEDDAPFGYLIRPLASAAE